jgi:hypothetical protein
MPLITRGIRSPAAVFPKPHLVLSRRSCPTLLSTITTIIEEGVTALHHVTEWDETTDSEAFVLLGDILCVAPHLVNMVTILNGRTGLFSAVRRGNMQMVKLLLKPGADISIRDGDNITAIELA